MGCDIGKGDMESWNNMEAFGELGCCGLYGHVEDLVAHMEKREHVDFGVMSKYERIL